MSQNMQLLPLKSLTPNGMKAKEGSDSLQGLNLAEVMKAFELTKGSYRRTRTKSCVPFPIPAKDCIPTMASAEQTELYETQFTSVLCGYLDNQTIGDLLKVYSHSDRQIPIGKISFLGSFFQKIIAKNISLDVAILCRDLETQNFLLPILQAIRLNCDHLTSHSDRRETFGVIIKIRKVGKAVTPIRQASKVDLVLAYDSAIAVPNRVLNQFKGIDYDRPLIAHITTLDSADIRCYKKPITHLRCKWDTKYRDVKISQEVFHQPNRRPERQHFFVWNEYVATEVAEWVALKQDIPYQFFRPEKIHAAIKAYRAWGGGHPLSTSPSKAAAALIAGNARSAAAAAGSSAKTKSKKKQKMKEEVQKGTAVSSSPSNVASLTPVTATSSTQPGSSLIHPFSPSSSTQVHTDRAPSNTPAFANNVQNATNALASTADSIDRIAQCHDLVPLLPSSQSQNPSIGEKRSNGEDQLGGASSSSAKKPNTGCGQSLPSFDFTSVLDEAMKKFEQQMNSLNTKI